MEITKEGAQSWQKNAKCSLLAEVSHDEGRECQMLSSTDLKEATVTYGFCLLAARLPEL